jgi:hypothetical protein
MTIHEAIKEAVRLSGRKQIDIANDARITATQIREYMGLDSHAKPVPSVIRLADIADATGCRIWRENREWRVERTRNSES